jgi:aminoglycoside phosphotransferase (APT) family kinase protein
MAWRHPNHRQVSSLPVELRRPAVPDHVRAWVARQTVGPVVGVRRLAGASSAAVHALYLADGNRLVLRRYLWPGFLDDEPLAPQREVDALSFAGVHHLPAPALVAADITGGDIGDGIPALLMTCLPGRAVPNPDVVMLAETLAAIHDTDPAAYPHHYFAWNQEGTTRPPAGAARPRLWERAIALWHNATPSYRPVLIHRDYHPGNVLWRRRALSGVVDWVNACRGPIGCDLATCRGNLVDLVGPVVADRFVATYTALTGEPLHPFWEMAGILEGDYADATAAELARQEASLARAVTALSG